MNWTVKKTTLIISKKEKKSTKNHTILSTYQELIKQERQKTNKENISSLYLYWATHMFWNICDDHYFTFGSTIFKLLYLLIIIIILKRKLLTSS